MRLSLALRAVLLALAVIGWAAAPALAAPQVLSTDPEEGAQLHKAPPQVTIEFSEPLEDSSDIEVEDGCGNRVDDNDVTIGGTLSNELSVGLRHTAYHGTYKVTYIGTGVTGTTSDSYTFDVHAGKSCDDSGGGHRGHGGNGHGGNGHGGNGHGGHDGNGEGKGGHGGDGHGGGGDDVDHGSMSGHDGDHKKMGGGHARHDRKPGKHDKHKRHQQEGDGDGDTQAPQAGDEIPVPTDIPTGTTVVLGLGLAVLMGALGGWVLRVSNPS